MSNVLTDLRVAVKATLTGAGFRTFTTVPDKVAPPCAFVSPGEPYITRENAAFGGEIVRHQVVIVAASGVNDVRAESLDALLLKALDALHGDDRWDVGDVDRPGQITLGGQQFLATSIELVQEIHREDP